MDADSAPKTLKSLTVATVLITFFMLSYVFFLIKTNFDSQVSLQQTFLTQFKLENERQASILGGLFEQRKSDLINIADSRAIDGFFENKALGMSMAYGLRQSLLPIRERFRALLERSVSDHKLIYIRIIFCDENGNVLSDVSSGHNRPQVPVDARKLLSRSLRKPAIIIKDRGKDMVVSMAYYFKGKYSGQIVAWLSPEFLQAQLSSGGRTSYISDDKEIIFGSGENKLLPGMGTFTADLPHKFWMEYRTGEKLSMVGVKSRIYDTPFFLLNVVPEQNLFGGLRPKELPVGMGILAVLIITGAVFTYRLHVKAIVLQTRLTESNLYKKEILEKNIQLEEEIAERTRAEHERSLTEAELRGSEERFRELADSLPQAVFECDAAGNFTYLNSTASEIFGFAPEKLEKGVGIFQMLVQEDHARAMDNMHAKISGNIKGYSEYTALKKDGTAFPAILNASPIMRDGIAVGLRGVLIDISEHKRFEAEMLKSQKMESIGILAGGIAHDFNNILTGILGNISLSKTALSNDNPIFKRLEQAENACMQAAALTRQLLTFSKGGSPIRLTIPPGPLIKDFATMAVRGTNVRIDFHIGDLWPIEADEAQFGQVVNNLIINACQSMPEGGVITITAENTLLDGKNEFQIKQGRYVKVMVKDEGIGIPKEQLQKIFDPYFTTKEKGSGLGLAVVYSIIKNHEGHIDIESTVGAGSTFTFYIPASEKELINKNAEKNGFHSGKGTILVMDDEEFIRTVAGAMLNQLGYEVVFAATGTEAIEIYKKASESGQVLAAVIMDLTIPGDIGGKEAVGELLKIDPGARVIVSSGYSNDTVLSDFQKYGFSGVIVKPYKIETLGKTLQKVINDSST